MGTILPALVSAAATLLVCLINNHYQRLETEKKHGETIALITYRINDLTDKVNKHNTLLERVYAIESKQEVTEEKIKVVNHRLDDLEKGA